MMPFAGADPSVFRDAIGRFGDSLYVYDIVHLNRHCACLRIALPSDVDVIYSVKANPNPHLIRHIARHTQGVEVSSSGEWALARAAGIAADRILLIGPAKSADEIIIGVTRDVRAIVLESADELAEVRAACNAHDGRARVMVRVNPDFAARGSKLKMSSVSTQFGVDFEEAVAIIEAARGDPRLEWRGLHVYTGTRILDAAAIVENCRNILGLAERLAHAVGEAPPEIDFGGGLGVPYYDNETQLDIDALGTGLDAVLAPYRAAHPGTRYLIETGRYVVAESGMFLTAIRRIKASKGATWVLTAGGTNHFAAHLFMGSLMRRNFPVQVVTRPGAAQEAEYHICGPLCTPSDILASGVRLPSLTPDDLIGIRNAGAYGYSNSPLGFLSHATPAEVAFDGSTLTSIRAVSGPEQFVRQTAGAPT